MFEDILQKDQELLIYLNNLGSEFWDPIWLGITNQFYWTPLFVLIFYLTIKTFGWKKGLFTIVMMIILVALSDQFTNLVKNTVMRIRPNNDSLIKLSLKELLNPQSYSFYSGHAATSSVFTVFVILTLKKHLKYIWLMVFFPLVFSYSRLYLGVHYPIDILTGLLMGTLLGLLYYKLYVMLTQYYFK